jgi:hypothetical protein
VISLLHHSFFSACCQRGNVLSIYLVCGTWTCMDLELWLVITFNSYACKTMWAWDLCLCACDHLLSFYFLRMLYVRLKILDECCFSLVFWKPGEFELFPEVYSSSGDSGSSSDIPDFRAWYFFCILVECMDCHMHVTITCCTSQAPLV